MSFTESQKITWAGVKPIGSLTGSAVYYSQDTSGNVACATTNQVRYIYYNITSTTNSADINSSLYMDAGKTILVPAGAYVMANGKKYIVNNSGVVTSITNTCTSNPAMFERTFRKSSFVFKFFTTNTYPIVKGNCYLFQGSNGAIFYIRGIVSEYNSATGEVTLINYSGG
jgi:hypothetical protein